MFLPAATARCITSSVAIIVVAIPFTRTSGDPATIRSTVSVIHGIPTLPLMRSTTSPAVKAPPA
jgi:hypothetical protein